MADCGWDDCDGRHRDRAGCDGGSVYLLGVDALKEQERELRAIEYRRRVKERKRMKATYIMLVIEILLLVYSFLTLIVWYDGGAFFGR